LDLEAPFRIKTRWGEIGVEVYGSISRMESEFPIDSLGILEQLDREIQLRKNYLLCCKQFNIFLFPVMDFFPQVARIPK